VALQPNTSTVPNIRYRSRNGLKPLDPSCGAQFLFPAAEAKHDRIEVSTNWMLPISTSHFDDFATNLDGRDGGGTDLFRISQPSMLTRKIETTRSWAFSASGRLTCWQNSPTSRADIVFSLNPTRWLAYQIDPMVMSNADDPASILRLNEERQNFLKSLTLDENDNFLPTVEHLGGETFGGRAQWWRSILGRYIEAVQCLTIGHFQSVSPQLVDGHPDCTPIPPFSFATPTQAEVYWELFAPLGATGIVCRLAQIAKRMDGQVRTFEWKSQGGEANAESFKLGLNATTDLKVYAKSRDRIRFEVTYTKNIGQIRFAPHATLEDKLVQLTENAARRVQRFWRGVAPALIETPGYGDMLTFMAKLNRHVPAENIPVILELLANRRVLARTGPAGAAPAGVCRALEHAGIIEKTDLRSQSKTYRLAPDYQKMFDEMALAGNLLNPVFTE